jgi:hypothetical protein
MYPSAIGLDDEPLYSEPDDEVRPSGDAAPRANDRRPRQDRERLPDRAVLVVDDDDDFREVLIDRLAAEGIPVVGASSATEALALGPRSGAIHGYRRCRSST